MIYNKYTESGEWAGITTVKDNFCTELPVKPLTVRDKISFSNGKWVYDYEEIKNTPEESAFFYSNYFPAAFYNENIFPENGQIILEKTKDISILIPCFGKSMYVKDCVKSCVNQTLKPVQIIVLAMDSETQALKDELEALDDIVKVVNSEKLNVCKARTKLVKDLCSTDWFVFCDADDMLERHCLEYLYQEEASVVYPTIWYMQEQGEPDNQEKPFDMPPFKNGHHSACMTLNMTALMHKQIFNEIGLDESLCDGGEDFDFNVRLLALKKYKVSCIWTTWYYYRRSNGLSRKSAFFKSHFEATKKNLQFLHDEYVKLKGYDENEQKFYENPSLKTACINRKMDFHFLVAEKRDILESKRIISRRKEPLEAYSKDSFITIGTEEFVDDFLVLGKTFDVFFLESPSLKCFEEDIPMIINKDVWDKVKHLTGWQRIIYLLDNYACFDTDFGPVYLDWDAAFEMIKNSKNQTETLKEQLSLLEEEYTFRALKPTTEITFSLHKGCNASCEYCNQGTVHKNTLTDEQMLENFDKAMTIAEQKVGSFVPGIIGGEPTLWSEDFIKKLLKRMKKYPLIKIYTNGYNQDSVWYKTDKVIINRHVLNWEDNPEVLYRKNLKKNEEPIIVVTSKNIDKLEKVVSDPLVHVFVTPCLYSENKEYDLSNKNIELLKELGSKYGFMSNTSCLKGNSKEIDCEEMTAMWCCKADRCVPLEEMEEDLTMCINCNCYKERV